MPNACRYHPTGTQLHQPLCCSLPAILGLCLPQVRFLQGSQHTWYAGAYTLFNTHEIATMSGEAWERLQALPCIPCSAGAALHAAHITTDLLSRCAAAPHLCCCCRPGGG
jgi:hypothetical protein